jgi:hypothetical protein
MDTSIVEALVRGFAEANCIGDLEVAAEFLGERLSNLDRGQRVTFFFPDEFALNAITVHGEVPAVGQDVFFSDYKLHSTYKQRRWIVKRVDFSVGVFKDESTAQALKKSIVGVPLHTYDCQVALVPWHPKKRKISSQCGPR